MSSASERRVWMGRLKAAGAIVLIVGVVAGALHFSSQLEAAGPNLLAKAGESRPIREVDVQTNGTLPRSVILDTLGLEEGANLLSIDLKEMKASLESLGQVKAAVVARRFPDALEVTIEEREPIGRFVAVDSKNEKQTLFMDAAGEVFEAKWIDPKFAKSLPRLAGFELERDEDGFSKVEGVESLAQLLSEAQAIAPHLYGMLKSVSLTDPDRLIVSSPVAKRIIFDRHADFREQLGKLDFVLDYYRGSVKGRIDQIDLSLGDQVPVS